jgi:[ribosomal protein S5]-alanine N-acetyltransferase
MLNLPSTQTMHVRSQQNAFPTEPLVCSDWRRGIHVPVGAEFTLRHLRISDAATLLAMLTTEEVARFISPPPTTVAGFERFIEWTAEQQAAGRYVCFGIVPRGWNAAVGLIQFRALDSGFSVAEWGFAIGSPFWGTGLFASAAEQALEIVFAMTGIHRLEARACLGNGRGNGVLRKLGAQPEAKLNRSFGRAGEFHDQQLWSILREDWISAHHHVVGRPQ